MKNILLRFKFWLVLFIPIIFLTGLVILKTQKSVIPQNQNTKSHQTEVTDYVSLIDALRRELGFESVVPANMQDISRLDYFVEPFNQRMVTVNEETFTIFEFQNEGSAQKAEKSVSPDGTQLKNNTISINYVSAPHFYSKGEIIALYVGKDQTILQILEKLLDTQFAGQ